MLRGMWGVTGAEPDTHNRGTRHALARRRINLTSDVTFVAAGIITCLHVCHWPLLQLLALPCASCVVQERLQLSYLCLGGLCLTDTEAPALASMPGLRELELYNAPELGPRGIAQLTELRELSRLLLNKVGCLRGISCSLRSRSKVKPRA